MKKILALICFITFNTLLLAQDIVGFWKSYDDKTGKPQMICAIYEYGNKYYGRVIASYNKEGVIDDSIETPRSRTTRLVGEPYYSGLDIIWDLKKKGTKYTDGEILDPRKGKVYDVEMWRHDDNLIVRGKLLIFGKNLTWYPASDNDFPDNFHKPDLDNMVPNVPQIK